jgi:hypothetical protein
VVDSNDKRRARLNIISHLLNQVPYTPVPQKTVKSPSRQKPGAYRCPEREYHRVPARF